MSMLRIIKEEDNKISCISILLYLADLVLACSSAIVRCIANCNIHYTSAADVASQTDGLYVM